MISWKNWRKIRNAIPSEVPPSWSVFQRTNRRGSAMLVVPLKRDSMLLEDPVFSGIYPVKKSISLCLIFTLLISKQIRDDRAADNRNHNRF